MRSLGLVPCIARVVLLTACSDDDVQYFLPAIPDDIHVISARNELYTTRAVGGEVMRDWLFGGFTDPDGMVDRVEEGTLVTAYPGVMPFECPVSP